MSRRILPRVFTWSNAMYFLAGCASAAAGIYFALRHQITGGWPAISAVVAAASAVTAAYAASNALRIADASRKNQIADRKRDELLQARELAFLLRDPLTDWRNALIDSSDADLWWHYAELSAKARRGEPDAEPHLPLRIPQLVRENLRALPLLGDAASSALSRMMSTCHETDRYLRSETFIVSFASDNATAFAQMNDQDIAYHYTQASNREAMISDSEIALDAVVQIIEQAAGAPPELPLPGAMRSALIERARAAAHEAKEAEAREDFHADAADAFERSVKRHS